jgi:single-strand DNA-binding protein
MINKMILQGRLVRDPDARSTQTGIPVAAFTVAWSEKYGETETQLFLDCTAWRGTAELVCKYFHKGKEIVVEGRLETQKWQDKDGNNRSTIKMTADRVHFCGSKADNDAGAVAGAGTADVLDALDESELPF